MKVIEYFGNKPVKGEVGIEIELEGEGIRNLEVPGWRMEDDGSLRGESVEFVLRKPIMRGSVRSSVARISTAIEKAGARVRDTGRAGVHIHLNVQELTMTQMFNFVCAYMIFEDTLINFCGEHRVGNLFCLRVRDADQLLSIIRDAITYEDYGALRGNNIRYASINLCSLGNYGSLEFRAMRSTVDPDLIDTWSGMLCAIKDWAVKFDDPRDIIMEFSQQGPEAIFKEVFGDYAKHLKMDRDELYEGVRNAQYVAFSTEDWNLDMYEKLKTLSKDMEGFPNPDAVEAIIRSRGAFFMNVDFSKHVTQQLEEFIEDRDAGMYEPQMVKVGKKKVFEEDIEFDEDEEIGGEEAAAREEARIRAAIEQIERAQVPIPDEWMVPRFNIRRGGE